VGALRLEHDSSAALGVPAHVTILFPFAPPAEVDEDAVAALVAAHPAFEFELATVEHWPQPLTYLAPVPAGPFLALTNAVWRRWPAYPPYEGAHETVIPHLTVGEAELALDAELPISCLAREVVLIEQDDAGRWSTRRRFPLQGVA